MTVLKMTKKERQEHAHECLYEGLGNVTATATLNLDAAHICYVSLHFIVGLIFDSAPDGEEALELIDNVMRDVLKDVAKEKDNE